MLIWALNSERNLIVSCFIAGLGAGIALCMAAGAVSNYREDRRIAESEDVRLARKGELKRGLRGLKEVWNRE